MKNISIYISLILTFCFVGCDDDFDEYIGSYFEFGTTSYTVTKAESDSFVVNLTSRIRTIEGELNIIEAGFISVGDTLLGTIKDGVINVTTKYPYQHYYRGVVAYVKTNEGCYTGNKISIFVDRDDYVPVLNNCRASMSSPGVLLVEADYSNPSVSSNTTSAYISIANQNFTATLNNGKLQGYIELDKLTANVSHSLIIIYAENNVGTGQGYINYEIKILEQAAIINEDDGLKEDCIRLGGVNWAKGNLQFVNNQWKIAERQDATLQKFYEGNVSFYHSNITSNIEHFYYGETDAFYLSNPYYQPIRELAGRTDIQGDKEFDVAAANINGWMMPNKEELEQLTKVSFQLGYTIVDGKKVQGVLFYNSGSNAKFKSISEIEFKSSDLNKMGLFLPIIGIRYYENKKVHYTIDNPETGLCYMSSTINYAGVDYLEVASLQWKGYSYSTYLISSAESSYKQMPVRPVKK